MKNQFIERFNKIHNHKYIYLINDDINTTSKIKIKCPEHGLFEQYVGNHLKGSGCRICGNIKKGLSKRIKLNEFIEKANIIHNNKYDYSKVKYSYNNDLIIIGCPVHGDFTQYLSHHYTKQKLGCPKCSYDERSKQKRLTDDEILKKIPYEILINFTYSLEEYKNSSSKIKIKCLTHDTEYKQIAVSFMKGHIGCPKCTTTSLGELKIKNYLDSNKIEYAQQHKFPDCKFKRLLSFDFYLPYNNICIEFDGIQHFKQLSRAGSNLTIQKKRDKCKDKYCIDNNIKLIRIPYWESQNIEIILKTHLWKF